MESKYIKRPEYLEDSIKNLKAILSELHQANVNLHNENEKLKKEVKLHKEQQAFNFTSLGETVNRVIELKEQLEIKEIINQDLVKKYQELEQAYNDLSKNMVEGLKVTLQHRVKPYLGAGVVNVIIETKEDFK